MSNRNFSNIYPLLLLSYEKCLKKYFLFFIIIPKNFILICFRLKTIPCNIYWMSVPLYQVLSFLWYSYNMSNYKVTQYKILVWLCGVQSISDMSGSGISTLLLPPPLLNNILNFKVIFQPPLITSPSPQRRVDRDQCTMSVVFMIKMKSIMFAFSQLSLH